MKLRHTDRKKRRKKREREREREEKKYGVGLICPTFPTREEKREKKNEPQKITDIPQPPPPTPPQGEGKKKKKSFFQEQNPPIQHMRALVEVGIKARWKADRVSAASAS